MNINPFGTGGIGLSSYYSPDTLQWMLGGTGGATANLVFSLNTNPFAFTTVSIPLTAVQGIVWSSDIRRWVIGGNGGAVIYFSNDGISWAPSTTGSTVFAICFDVTYVPRQSAFIAVGQAGTATIAYSLDGQVWTAVSGSTGIYSNYGGHVCTSWASNLILTTGLGTANTIASSPTNYTTFAGLGPVVFNGTQAATSCAYGANGMFVVTGLGVATTLTAGYATIGGTADATTGTLFATRYTNPSGAGLMNFVSVFLSAGTGSATLGVYTDSGQGYPGTLIAAFPSATITPLGFTPFGNGIAGMPLPSGSFWIAFTQSNTLARARNAVSGGVTVSYAFTYGTALPQTFPSTGLTTTNNVFTMIANFNTANDLAYTYDGVTFLGVTDSFSLFSGQGNDVAYSPSAGLWVASGSSTTNAVAYSGQGTGNWSLATFSGFSNPGNVTAIATYTTSSMSPTSKQGVFALSGVMPITPTQNQLKFLIGGTSGTAGSGSGMGYTLDNTNVFTYSPQGTGTTLFNGPVRTIVYAPELGIWLTSVQTAAAVYQNSRSTNPFESWTVINSGITTATAVTSFTWSSTQQIFLATVQAATNNCYWSRTGVQWTVSACAAVFGTAVFSSAYSRQQNLWVAVGQGATHNIAYTSNVAGTWTGVGGLTLTSARTVTFAPNIPLWVIGGVRSAGSTSILVTINPAIQTPVAATTQPFGTTGAIVNRCYYGGQGTTAPVFVCVATPGTGSTGTIAWSSDGNTWTGLGTSIFSTAGFGVFYDLGSALWVAAGQGTNQVAKSVDGKTWTSIATAPFTSAATVVYAPVSIANSLTREMYPELINEYKRIFIQNNSSS